MSQLSQVQNCYEVVNNLEKFESKFDANFDFVPSNKLYQSFQQTVHLKRTAIRIKCLLRGNISEEICSTSVY